MRRLIMALLAVALAVPAAAQVTPSPTPGAPRGRDAWNKPVATPGAAADRDAWNKPAPKPNVPPPARGTAASTKGTRSALKVRDAVRANAEKAFDELSAEEAKHPK